MICLPLIGDRIMVAELKHVAYFDSIGIDLVALFASEVSGWATADNLITECFELEALAAVKSAGVPGDRIFLMEGTPAYAQYLTAEGLAALPVDGVSFDKHQLLASTGRGNVTGVTTLVARSHAAGLRVFTWTPARRELLSSAELQGRVIRCLTGQLAQRVRADPLDRCRRHLRGPARPGGLGVQVRSVQVKKGTSGALGRIAPR